VEAERKKGGIEEALTHLLRTKIFRRPARERGNLGDGVVGEGVILTNGKKGTKMGVAAFLEQDGYNQNRGKKVNLHPKLKKGEKIVSRKLTTSTPKSIEKKQPVKKGEKEGEKEQEKKGVERDFQALRNYLVRQSGKRTKRGKMGAKERRARGGRVLSGTDKFDHSLLSPKERDKKKKKKERKKKV